MSTPEDPLKKGQEFLQIVAKAKEFTEELLKENERLRFKIASLESGGRPRAPPTTGCASCSRGSATSRSAWPRCEARYRKVEDENKEFADRYIEIEEQNNNLANLYVASYQLHSTLDYQEVVRIVQEIVINLIGAEAFHLLMVGEKTGQLELETSEGQAGAPDDRWPWARASSARPRRPARTSSRRTWPAASPRPSREPLAVIPLKIKDSVIGVISINKLLVQKTQFTTMDYELFTLLAGHAATAIFAAKLYSTSARKLTTLQGFLDMIKTQPGH